LKKLDAYIIKSFLKPFLATFFVILFVLVMQGVWLGFDEISGKGIELNFILKFIGYLTLTVVPMAMPIGILLSSIMAVGNFAENYEFAAIKSAGISLRRFIAPIMFLTIFLSGINFMFLNYVYPHAVLKQKNMFSNIKKKQPALALVAGSFNTDIPGYVIKFDEKYGEDQNFLKNVQISDLSSNYGKTKVITAKEAEITSEEGSRYMTFILKDGNYYEEHTNRRDLKKKRLKMPSSKATFEKYTINIDISSFSNKDIDKINVDKHQQMLSLKQLLHESDTTKLKFNNNLAIRSNNLRASFRGNELRPYPDSIPNQKLNPDILENFNLMQKIGVISNAQQHNKRELENLKRKVSIFKRERKILNLYDYEYHYRLAFSLACLVLFFIGAPLGSIIRKGGFGLPMVLAIVIFVTYFFISSFGRNLSEESAISAALGGWLSTLILLPFGILLTRRAAKDMGIFNIDTFFENLKNFFNKVSFKK
jgi:lipopolysaccharide export system permease protein